MERTIRKDREDVQGNFKGTNYFCRGCKKDCKQFENVKVIACPNFTPVKVGNPILGGGSASTEVLLEAI